MTFIELLPLLSVATLLAFIGYAIYSKKKTEDRMDDSSARKSTLAADQNSHAKPADV